ncbi:MAG TPA: sulfite exporter TauE/SafE family protein [Pedococcus sp.]|nr:sulfite exporter TauE/SafE family protein [Pedococcus sp.]
MSTVLLGALSWVVLAGILAGVVNSTIGFGNLASFLILTGLLGVPALGAHLANQVSAPASFATAAWVSRHSHAATWPMVAAGSAGTLAGGAALAILPSDWVGRAAPIGVAAGAVLLVLVPLTRRLRFGWQLPGLTVAGLWGGTVGAGVGSFVMPCVDGPAAPATRNVVCLPMGLAVAAPLAALSPDRINWTHVVALASGMLIGGYLGATLLSWLPRKQSTSDRLREAMAVVAVGAFAYLWTDSLGRAGYALLVAASAWLLIGLCRHYHRIQAAPPGRHRARRVAT